MISRAVDLLLHGENGSGKSSLYVALKRFFEERGGLIAEHRNHFADSSRRFIEYGCTFKVLTRPAWITTTTSGGTIPTAIH